MHVFPGGDAFAFPLGYSAFSPQSGDFVFVFPGGDGVSVSSSLSLGEDEGGQEETALVEGCDCPLFEVGSAEMVTFSPSFSSSTRLQ